MLRALALVPVLVGRSLAALRSRPSDSHRALTPRRGEILSTVRLAPLTGPGGPRHPLATLHACAWIAACSLFSCSAPRPAPTSLPAPFQARAYVIREQGQLIGGPTASGKLGDIRLDNGLVSFIVDSAGPGYGFAHTGGNIVDADLARGGNDLLNQVFLYLDDTFPRQAHYDSVAIVDDGANSGTARVVARGKDSEDPRISITTEYSLGPGTTGLRIVTTLVNKGPDALTEFGLGDAVQWGAADHFAPGFGNRITGKTIVVPWVAALGMGTSYAWSVPRGEMVVLSGNSWSDPVVQQATLLPNRPVRMERWLFVGNGDVATLLDPILTLRGEPRGAVRGRVSEEGTNEPVANARFIIHKDGAPYATVLSGIGGLYFAPLPPGDYTFNAATFSRDGPQKVPVTVPASGEVTLDLRLSLQGRVRWEIDAEDGTPLPAKLSFAGLAPSEDPLFGPAHQADGAVNTVLTHTGRGERHVGPGRYRVFISRGIEYDLESRDIAVEAGAVATVKVTLRRTVQTPGWIGADFHQHGKNSYDSAVLLRDRVISNVAEGVELMVATDHNWVTDYAPTIRNLGVEKFVRSVIGNEATTHTVGHFNCFPYTHKPDAPMGGSFQAEGMTPRAIFARCRQDPLEKVVQVNHPRGAAPVKGTGYFDEVGLDPRTGESRHPEWDDSFDAVELFNGKRIKDAERVLQDWFNLLNRGKRYTATGNSDTHQIWDNEAGYPRNLVWLGTDAASEVTDAMLVRAVKEEKRIVVTNGPFVELTVDGAPIGSTVTPAKKGTVQARVLVQAANWVSVDKVDLVVSGAVAATFPLDPEAEKALRLDRTLALPLDRDAWVVAVARGSRSLAPVIPEAKTGAMTALAVTNPIWVDADGDGKIATGR